jgi:hypothetical protein
MERLPVAAGVSPRGPGSAGARNGRHGDQDGFVLRRTDYGFQFFRSIQPGAKRAQPTRLPLQVLHRTGGRGKRLTSHRGVGPYGPEPDV